VRNLDRHLPPGASAVSLFWLLDYVPDVERRRTVPINLLHETIFDSANSFRGLLRANVRLSDVKNHALNKLEDIFLVAIALRMLFPDERVGRDGEKIVPVFRRKRAKLDEFAF